MAVGQRGNAVTALTGVANLDVPVWTVQDGRPGRLTPSGVAVDGGAPNLGPSGLVAGPGGSDTAVAVARDGTVWRRTATAWQQSLVLLPEHIFAATPPVTAIAAFSSGVTATIYLATDGYGVLISQDGGDTWIRADPGLPGHVLTLATSSADHAVYAGTTDGLWVHHLRAPPAPPVYVDSALWLRRGGMLVVSLLATVAAVAGLRRALPAVI